MTLLWFCLVLVALNILLVAWAARRVFSDRTLPAPAERDRPSSFADEVWLALGDAIFDPCDYLWLRDEVCFPDAAELLARHRRALAIRWLRCLGDSFKELAGTPAPNAVGEGAPGASRWPGTSTVQGWHLFWSGLRFQLLLNYALIVVHLSGPYHRIVPPIDGLSAILRRKPARTAPIHNAD